MGEEPGTKQRRDRLEEAEDSIHRGDMLDAADRFYTKSAHYARAQALALVEIARTLREWRNSSWGNR